MEIVSTLSSFGSPVRAVVIGASGAIGGALVDMLAGCPQVDSVLACSRTPHPHTSSKVTSRPIDILDEACIATALIEVERVDVAIVATGRLHAPGGIQPEKSWRSLAHGGVCDQRCWTGARRQAPAGAAATRGQGRVRSAVRPRRQHLRQPPRRLVRLPRLKGRFEPIHPRAQYRACPPAQGCDLRRPASRNCRQSALSRPFQSSVGRLFTPMFAAERLLTVMDGLDVTQTRWRAHRAINANVVQSVRGFLVRRHKAPSRGARRFSGEAIFGELGVLSLSPKL